MDDSEDFLSKIFEYADSQPNKLALIDEEAEITYFDLRKRVQNTVALLRKLNFAHQCIVLQLPRGIQFTVMVLALTDLKVTFIPQDISQPKARLDQMIEIAKATVVISLNDVGRYVFNFMKGQIKTTNAWAIYFTSGSTGTPKAVEIPRRNVSNLVKWEKFEFELTNSDRVAAYTPYSFAVSYIELFSTLYSGATLYIMNETIRHDLKLLESYLVKNSITFMNTTAVIGAQIIQNMNIPSLRILTLTGQKFPSLDLKNSTFRIFNVYGNTECGAATIVEVSKDSSKITIGKPVAQMNALVLDENRNVLSEGNIGELFLFGPQIADGYYLNEQATAETFIKIINPLDSKKILGYRTGDFVRRLSDGNIEYLGRKDRQYKINGIRIDLSEIDKIIQRIIPDLEQSHLIVRNNHLYCWIISKTEEKEEAIINKMQQLLPPVMIPSRIIQIQSFPLNGNGKTDENKLLESITNNRNTIDERKLSKQQVKFENYLKKAWAQILNIDVDNIHYNSDFRKLGATSLQIMELGVKILQEVHQRINFVELHLHSRLDDMAVFLIEEDNFRPIYTFVERTNAMEDQSALFVIHSGNTGSDVYRPLFENIKKSDFPIYVIEPYNLLTSGKRIDGIENIAEYYIKLIANFKPEKDFSNIKLMGWSYGGVIASEMCHQYQKNNMRNVDELIVLDSPFYLDRTDYALAKIREKNGYYRKYFENTHIFEGMGEKNITTERLLKNNHNVFQDLYQYVPKPLSLATTFVRSLVEDRPLSNQQIGTIFKNCKIVDVFSKHDYLFVEEETRSVIQDILSLTPLESE